MLPAHFLFDGVLDSRRLEKMKCVNLHLTRFRKSGLDGGFYGILNRFYRRCLKSIALLKILILRDVWLRASPDVAHFIYIYTYICNMRVCVCVCAAVRDHFNKADIHQVLLQVSLSESERMSALTAFDLYK